MSCKFTLSLNFREFFYGIADRTETIGTEENISAIRAVDVSGRDGEAVLSYYSAREIAIVFFNENVGQGYNVSLELYTTRSGAATRSLSVFSIALSMIVVSLYVF